MGEENEGRWRGRGEIAPKWIVFPCWMCPMFFSVGAE